LSIEASWRLLHHRMIAVWHRAVCKRWPPVALHGHQWQPLSASNSNKVKRRTGGTMDRNNQQLADMILDWRARNADKQ
jgi:hypothetical protein